MYCMYPLHHAIAKHASMVMMVIIYTSGLVRSVDFEFRVVEEKPIRQNIGSLYDMLSPRLLCARGCRQNYDHRDHNHHGAMEMLEAYIRGLSIQYTPSTTWQQRFENCTTVSFITKHRNKQNVLFLSTYCLTCHHTLSSSQYTTVYSESIFVLTSDGRVIVGTLVGHDQVQNLIVNDAHERVYSADEDVDKVELGLYVIRGDTVCLIAEYDGSKLQDDLRVAVPLPSIQQHQI